MDSAGQQRYIYVQIVLNPGSLACSNINCLLTMVNKKYLPEIRPAWENYTAVVLSNDYH